MLSLFVVGLFYCGYEASRIAGLAEKLAGLDNLNRPQSHTRSETLKFS